MSFFDETLSNDVLFKVFSGMNTSDLRRSMQTNHRWRSLINDYQRVLPGMKNISGKDVLHSRQRNHSSSIMHMLARVQMNCPAVASLDLTECYVDDAVLQTVATMSTLTSLNLGSCSRITDTGLRYIQTLTRLTTLEMGTNCVQITNAGLTHIAGLKHLTTLKIDDCPNVTNRELEKFILRCSQLTTLRLSNCEKITHLPRADAAKKSQLASLDLDRCPNITDAGLEHIARFKHLTSLKLRNTKITDAGLWHVAGLTTLTSLNLNNCVWLRDAGLKHVVEHLPRLTSLSLHRVPKGVTDAVLKHIAGLKHLTTLDVSMNNLITDAGLGYIQTLDKLTTLNLGRCRSITGAGVAGLKHITSLDLWGCPQLRHARSGVLIAELIL